MNTKNRVSELEKEIKEIRYQLMLKGSELHFLKDKPARIPSLTMEVTELRQKLHELNDEIAKYKFPYIVAYEITSKVVGSDRFETDTFRERHLLDKDLNIDVPNENGWNWDKEGFSDICLEILTNLNNRYGEVTLLSIKRIK